MALPLSYLKTFNSLYNALGGWLLVTNVTCADKSQSTAIFNQFTLNLGSIGDLVNATNGRYTFGVTNFAALKTHTKFTEMRIYCRKKFHGRTFHAVFSSQTFIDYVTGTSTNSFNYCNTNTPRYLDDNTSLLSQQPCSNIFAKSAFNVYNHFMYVAAKYHILLRNADFACDDRSTDTNWTAEGVWLYFVRWNVQKTPLRVLYDFIKLAEYILLNSPYNLLAIHT